MEDTDNTIVDPTAVGSVTATGRGDADPNTTGLGDAAGSVTATGLGDADPNTTGLGDAAGSVTVPNTTGTGNADGTGDADGSVDGEETESVASVDESPKVCVQMVKDKDTYKGIAEGTTIAIKNGDGTYTVFKKDANSPDFSPGNTYQQLDELSGGKRRKTAKRGGKSAKRGRKSAKRSRKTAKKGRKGKGSRRSKK